MDVETEASDWQIVLGPGARLQALAEVLSPAFARVPVASLSDLEDIESAGCGVLVLDADPIDVEDLGYLKRVLARRSGLELVLTGSDATRHVARTLLRLAGARWMSWPPDLHDLQELASAGNAEPWLRPQAQSYAEAHVPSATAPSREDRDDAAGARTTADDDAAVAFRSDVSRPRSEARFAGAARLEDDASSEGEANFEGHTRQQDEIAAIEAILGSRKSREDAEDDARFERPPFEIRTTQALPNAPVRAPKEASAPAAPHAATYFRDQVADLADIAQRLDLSYNAVHATPENADADDDGDDVSREPWQAVGNEVARLVQFTRTLGYLVAPPPPGDQVFDLAELVELFVAGLAQAGPGSPRGLFRSSGPLRVRSDRALLGQALDAMFFLARSTASEGEIVRVELGPMEFSSRAVARLSIQFPTGPLREMTPAKILEPYGLRRVFPKLGPNALSAAVAIIEGQGGSVSLGTAPSGRSPARLEWMVLLPREREADAGSHAIGDSERERSYSDAAALHSLGVSHS